MRLPRGMSLAVVQADSFEPSVSQTLLLGIAVIAIFGLEVFTTGFVARKLRIEDASYGRALWASVLKNVTVAVLAYLSGRYVGAISPEVGLLVLGAVVPMVMYKLVFESTLGQAVLIWIAVLAIDMIAAVSLLYGALTIGERLDRRFRLSREGDRPIVGSVAHGARATDPLRCVDANRTSFVSRQGAAPCRSIS